MHFEKGDVLSFWFVFTAGVESMFTTTIDGVILLVGV